MFRGLRASDPRNGPDPGILDALSLLAGSDPSEAAEDDRRWRESRLGGR